MLSFHVFTGTRLELSLARVPFFQAASAIFLSFSCLFPPFPATFLPLLRFSGYDFLRFSRRAGASQMHLAVRWRLQKSQRLLDSWDLLEVEQRGLGGIEGERLGLFKVHGF